MTHVYLKTSPSSFELDGEQNDEQHLRLFLLSSNAPPSSLSCPTSFSPPEVQRPIIEESQQPDQMARTRELTKTVNQFTADGGSSDVHAVSSSSLQPMMGDVTDGYNMWLRTRETTEGNISTENSSSKWMSSKMRLMQKMMNSNCTTEKSVSQRLQHQIHDSNEPNSSNNSNNSIRVCADCNTTTTPLWRSGPRGPKSLCNACGIRQRKARRTMELAANGAVAATEPKMKWQNKEKKSLKIHIAHHKKQCNKSPDPPHNQSQRKLCFKDFALSLRKNSTLKQMFPQDVEEAAILLMELSCGFMQS
ncbi:putative GATA transcription factor 22 [Mangifera indica]|uniref:putative GATA transcription factor 22 n=1 Tax=Mangifera indica TaxID=29780 RepID=UPI001CF9D38F|nr:putative GATA transcription factor 22 [Mangifera indica]